MGGPGSGGARPGAGAPKGNKNNPNGHPASLVPGAGQKKALTKSGRYSEEIREKIRPIVATAIDLIEAALEGRSGNPDPTLTEIINALRILGPYVMTELRPVVDKVVCEIFAEEMARDERVPAEAITDITERVVARLTEQ